MNNVTLREEKGPDSYYILVSKKEYDRQEKKYSSISVDSEFDKMVKARNEVFNYPNHEKSVLSKHVECPKCQSVNVKNHPDPSLKIYKCQLCMYKWELLVTEDVDGKKVTSECEITNEMLINNPKLNRYEYTYDEAKTNIAKEYNLNKIKLVDKYPPGSMRPEDQNYYFEYTPTKTVYSHPHSARL